VGNTILAGIHVAATWEVLHSSNHLFLDLPGKLASENTLSTIPNNLCYTTLKPDIVVLIDLQKTSNIWIPHAVHSFKIT